MKNAFRIFFLVILSLIILYTLVRNKKAIEFETRNAKQSILRIPVRTAKIIKDVPVKIIKAAGSVNAVRESYIISTQAGEIVGIRVKAGDFIEKGTVIAQVNDFYARKEYDIALQAYEQINKDYQRYKSLSETDAITGQQMEQLKLQMDGAETRMTTLKKRLDETLIRSTLSGYVNQVLVKTGGMLGQGSPVCEVVSPGDVTINTGLPLPDINLVNQGTPAKISIQPGEGFQADALVISRGIKPDFSGKFPVILEFKNPVKNIFAGTVVDIEFTIRGDSSYIIPATALARYNDKEGFFRVENGIVIFCPVLVTGRYEEMITVSGDINEGTNVVTEGLASLSDSSQVLVVSH